MSDQLETSINAQINAVDMEPGQIYFNAAGKIKVKLIDKKDGVVFVSAWSDAHQEWRKVKVEETYKLKIPTKGEIKMAETAEKEVKQKVAKVKAPPKNLGKVRGLKMLATWGQVYKDVGTQGLAAVKQAMLEEFPDRAESIERWAPAYRIYFNTGRLPGVDKPEVPVVFETEMSEKKKARLAATLAKKAEREAKQQLKLEEMAAKKAARLEAKAQKAAEKEAREEAKAAELAASKAAQ